MHRRCAARLYVVVLVDVRAAEARRRAARGGLPLGVMSRRVPPLRRGRTRRPQPTPHSVLPYTFTISAVEHSADVDGERGVGKTYPTRSGSTCGVVAPDLRPVGVAAPLPPCCRPEAELGSAPRWPYPLLGARGPHDDPGADMCPAVAACCSSSRRGTRLTGAHPSHEPAPDLTLRGLAHSQHVSQNELLRRPGCLTADRRRISSIMKNRSWDALMVYSNIHIRRGGLHHSPPVTGTPAIEPRALEAQTR